MKTEIVPCDFTTAKEKGFTWFRNYQGVGTATLYHDGLLEFQGSKHRVFIENIGTPDEKVIINDISDLDED
jgi:hypothetical protein